MPANIIQYNLERRHPKDESDRLWLKLALQFQSRRFFKQFMVDGRQQMPSNGKSS